MQIPHRQSPEEQYLQKMREELAELETELAESEEELHALRGNIIGFEKKYDTIVSAKYAQLDELNAQIAEISPPQPPADEPAVKPSENAAPPSKPRPRRIPPKAAAKPKPPPSAAPVVTKPADLDPAEAIKRLYRDIAKSIHPDHADGDSDRAHRHTYMIRANAAYEAANEEQLLSVYHEWEQAPESVRGEGAAADLVRVIRRIAWCERRLDTIAEEIEEIENSGLFGLKQMVEEAQKFQRDLLAEMTSRIEADIAVATEHLAQLVSRSPLPAEGAGWGGEEAVDAGGATT